VYYRVILILKDNATNDPEDLFDDLYGKSLGKGKIVELESIEPADDFDDSEMDNLSSLTDDE